MSGGRGSGDHQKPTRREEQKHHLNLSSRRLSWSTKNIVTVFVGFLLLVLLIFSGYREFGGNGQETPAAKFVTRVVEGNPVRDYIQDIQNQQEEQQKNNQQEKQEKPFQSTGNLTVHFLDVGHGDSILIVTPMGSAILLDGGYEDQGRYVLTYLKSLGFNYLDYAIASHPHADHIGGLDFVLGKLAFVNTVLDNGKGPENASPSDWRSYRSFRRAAMDQGEYRTIRKDTILQLDDTVYVEVLVPFDNGRYFNNTNDNSLVVKLTYGNVSFLFTGDCEVACEERLLKKKMEKNIHADILKVGHHGANDASSQEFLDAVKPTVAIISTGDYAQFGHPHESVVKRLGDNHLRVYRTDQDGNIIITTDGSTYNIDRVSRDVIVQRDTDIWHAAVVANATNTSGVI